MSAGLIGVSPLDLAYGSVLNGAPHDMTITLYNSGDDDLTIDEPTLSSGQLAAVGSFPLTIAPGASTTYVLEFTPTGGALVATVTYTSDGLNTPLVGNVTGTGIAAGTKALTPNPSSWNFGSQKVGTSSAEKLITLTNSGSVNVQITIVAFTGDFIVGGTNPALPATLIPGGTYIFGAKYSPSAEGYTTQPHGVRITSDAAASPLDIVLSGTGYLLTPVYTITGGTEVCLAAFTNATVKELDPTTACEENSVILKLYDMYFPDMHQTQQDPPERGYEKTCYRLEIYWEDYGNVTFTASMVSYTNGTTTTNSQQLALTGVNNGKCKTAFFDLECTGELLELTLTRTSGIASIVLIIFSYEPQGESKK